MFFFKLGNVNAMPCNASNMMPRYLDSVTISNLSPPQVHLLVIKRPKEGHIKTQDFNFGHTHNDAHRGTELAHKATTAIFKRDDAIRTTLSA